MNILVCIKQVPASSNVRVDPVTGVLIRDGAVRAAVCEYLGYLGVKIDPELNKKRGTEMMISTPDSKVQVWVVPTNEELMIAQDTAELVNSAK